MIIGVTGFLCAGKGKVADYIVENYGFQRLSTGDEVRKEANELGIEHTRINLQALGDRRRIESGGEYWISKLLMNRVDGKNYIIEGIRNPGEIDILSKEEFHLIGIDAPYELRLARALARNRGRKEDNITPEQFALDDANDKKGQSGKGQQSQICFDKANYKIMNDLGYQELELKIRMALDSFGLPIR